MMLTRRAAAIALLVCFVGCKDCRRESPATREERADAAEPADAAPKLAMVDAGGHVDHPHGTSRADLEASFTPAVTTLDDLPRFLPRALTQSFVLKHGRNRTGERGHLVEKRISQSADPQAPRAILWDERSGLVASYNGGLPEQKNGQRLDVHFFDATKNTFALEAVEFPVVPGHPVFRTTDCATCHGPRMRPIFSMYPDWPGFYGSDNDELSNARVAVQVAELADYVQFRRDVASKHPRYAPLFANSEVDAGAGDDRKPPPYETFPYRPDVSEDIHAVSRAFAFRPGLRLGILLNRLQARALVTHVKQHARYAKLGRAFLSNLLECGGRTSIDAKLRRDIEDAIGEPLKLAPGTTATIHYRQLWKIFDLEVRDVDIRYSYMHENYRSDDASNNPMGVGYIGPYWSSYFDGSATIDELVAYGLYEDQARSSPSSQKLAGLVTPNGLTKKYEHLAERFRLDATFFANMDAQSLWIPIPYPRELNDVHHREGFGAAYKKQHEALCETLL